MKYRQLSQRLRFSRGPGKPVEEFERPRNTKTGVFLDSDAEPTLVEVTAACSCDVESLLAIGAIAPYAAPKARSKVGPAKLEVTGAAPVSAPVEPPAATDGGAREQDSRG